MYRLLIFAALIIFTSCNRYSEQHNIYIPTDSIERLQINKYLHISHTRTGNNLYVDPEAQKIDYSKYNMLWLGGDMANLTSIHDTIMNHVDTVFNLRDRNTLWTLGNHDYVDLDRVLMFTKKRSYYARFKNDISFIILDTEDSLTSILGKQKKFLNEVLDTIEKSSHLVILHHRLMWLYGHPKFQDQINKISNGKFGDCTYCLNPNNFYQDIYPRLVDIKKRGIEVICLAGDLGFRTKEFEFLTKDGIYFLASGIDSGKKGNKALLFSHNIQKGELDWEYVLLSDL